MPTVESQIETHLLAGMATAYPALDADSVIIKWPQGEMIYDRNRQRGCVGSEALTVAVAIASDDPVDRRPFLRTFRRKNVTLVDGTVVFQEIRRHAHSDYVDVVNVKGYVFFMTFTHDVFEDEGE